MTLDFQGLIEAASSRSIVEQGNKLCVKMRQYATFLLAFLGLLLRSGLALRRQLPPSRITSRGMISVDSLLTAVEVVTKPDGYVYGAVEAPPIIPIVGVCVITQNNALSNYSFIEVKLTG